MERGKRGLQHLGLPTACAVVYAHITGVTPDPRASAEMHAILDDVAHALSNLVPIYVKDEESGMPRELAPIELIQGRFSRGAHVFTAKNGRELRGLSVQRRDMLSALEILKSAHVSFRKPGDGR